MGILHHCQLSLRASSPIWASETSHRRACSQATANWAKEIEKTLNIELNERQTFFKTARKMCKENRLLENFNLRLYT